jgi:nucleotide-binding universal stress UspA family protein
MTDARLVGDVVVAVDFSELGDGVVAEAVALATASGGTLHMVHVAGGEPVLAGYDKEEVNSFTRDARAGELTEEHAQLRKIAEEITATNGLTVAPLVIMGPTAERLLDAVAHTGATHLVLGSHGRGGLHHLLVGSVAEEVLRHTLVPVVLVPVR